MIGLTPRQTDVLAYLRAYSAEHGFFPSYREIADALGIKAVSTAWLIVQQLIDRGYVRRLPRRERALELVDPTPDLSLATTDALWDEIGRRQAVREAA